MFGRRIAAERTLLGFTQEDLAKELDCSPATVGYWEREEREPSLANLFVLAELFNCSIDWIVGYSFVRN